MTQDTKQSYAALCLQCVSYFCTVSIAVPFFMSSKNTTSSKMPSSAPWGNRSNNNNVEGVRLKPMPMPPHQCKRWCS